MIFSAKQRKTALITAFVFLAPFLIICKAHSQTTLAVLEGTVKEEGGDPLPGAGITIRNTESGYLYSTTSFRDGRYIISGIQPGIYDSEVTLPGFATQKRKGLSLSVGARLKVDFTVKPAILEKEVTVTAVSPLVEVTRSDISNVVDRKTIESIPISLTDKSFEGWSYLTITTAGVTTNGTDQGGNAQAVAYGEILIDGVSNERIATGRATMGIPADAIQEFRVITNQFQAEFGNASGLVRSALTRSGSNDFRGRLSSFYRDESFNDVNYFVNHKAYKSPELPEDQYAKPKFSYTRFGGFLGGPIKRDKAHFFLAYDGLFRTSYATITSPLVVQETIPMENRQNQIMAKLDYQLNEKNHFSFRYSFASISRNRLIRGSAV